MASQHWASQMGKAAPQENHCPLKGRLLSVNKNKSSWAKTRVMTKRLLRLKLKNHKSINAKERKKSFCSSQKVSPRHLKRKAKGRGIRLKSSQRSELRARSSNYTICPITKTYNKTYITAHLQIWGRKTNKKEEKRKKGHGAIFLSSWNHINGIFVFIFRI